MPIINRIAAYQEEMKTWRRGIHAHPETAFDEHRTSQFVAEKLAEFGIAVDRSLAGTGVVGTLKIGSSPRAIGLRADMDALHIHEKNEMPHRSTIDGKMHACGHDGHTTMLLGAAKYLAETRNFNGTVHFIFQPAEENEGGGRVMVEQGLFEKFPVDAVYGMHNMPEIKTGQFGLLPGPVMASADNFEITVVGKGSHAAMPYLSIDPVVVASNIVMALQTIVSRNIHALDGLVVSVTQIHGGETWNVIPVEVALAGTARCFKPEVRDMAEARIGQIAQNVAAAYGATVKYRYIRRYPPTINSVAETEIAAATLDELVGPENVQRSLKPTLAAEDFAYMLQARPGCYIWIGNAETESSHQLHTPLYDFNDEILPLGASYWARLVERQLPR